MPTLTRKVQIIPVGDKEEVNRVYSYLRNAIEVQNKAMNEYLAALYVANVLEASKDDRKELNRLYTRISTSKKGSAYTTDFKFPTGLPCTSSLGQKVRQDFSNQMKKGLMYGRVQLATYKADNPLIIHVDYVRLRSLSKTNRGIYHNYENHTELLNHLYERNAEVYISFANNITFQVIFGQPHKSYEIRNVFQNIFEKYYLVQGSSIQINGKKIILNLSINIPKKDNELDENVVCGVDLGIAIPAVCGLNTNEYARKSIGNISDLLRVRTQLQSQRRRLQKNLKTCKGGHGRKKKLRKLNISKSKERNFVQTYNHTISKQVVDFALKNKAKYINLENLEGYDSNDFILRNWSYYQLQQYITYKAEMNGIEVRKINPYRTSQTCSVCGHWEEGQRLSQSEFWCKNPKCKNYRKIINADFNASRNIALSKDFV